MTTIDLACHDASCAPPPVGTGGSKPGRGALSPKRNERTNQPVSAVRDIYELRKHGLRETFDGEIRGGLSFGEDTDVRWVSDDYGWFIEGSLVDRNGTSVGYFERAIGLKDGKLVATHETLRVSEEHQGKGIAQAFNDHLLNWYQKIGVDRIELIAGHEMGPFHWARQGYRIQGEGGENRKRWVANRLKLIEQDTDDPDVRSQVRALRTASDRGEDVQPIHVASIGQDIPALHWRDKTFGDMWPGKAVLVAEDYQEDRSREYDGVYYLEGRKVPTTVASAVNNFLTRE